MGFGRAKPGSGLCAFSSETSEKQTAFHSTLTICGGIQLPFRIDGSFSFGQYIRSIGRNAPLGAGNQFASLSLPGDSFWKYSVTDPSALGTRLLRGLTVNLFKGFGTNHQPLSISYIVIDQKPSTGGSWPLAKVSVYLLAPVSDCPSLSVSV